MGNNQPKEQAPKPTIDDAILDMKLASKRFTNESKKCEKEKEKLMNQAKATLKKNNEEGAKLFLTSAMNKQREAENLQKMAHKMDYLQGVIKSNTNSTKLVDALAKISPIMNEQIQNMPLEKVYQNMNQFEKAMDEMQVQGNIMTGMMNQNNDIGQNLAIEQMMGQLKQEIHSEVSNDLNANPNVLFKELNQQNPQQNVQAISNNQIK
ncbi:unnamed protein product [Paramecium pentaurelia]|uniref:Charged multivesicular body protein 1a n=1 Tax=Paramecium pentaurelia TaxID=43138 RepID=A0A8S1UZ26_9CILI|nr:unnamed protein product [Paramecium pentaurelia]